MLRSTLLLTSAAAALAVPASAMAASAQISPDAVDVTPAGVTRIQATNTGAHALSGKATITLAGRTVASKNVRLPKRVTSVLTMKVDAKAVDALRAADGRATIAMRLKRAGRRKASTVRRTVTLHLAGAAQPAGGPAPQQQGAPTGPQTPAATPPAPKTHFLGRMGTDGAYDDLEMDVVNGVMTITKTPLVPVLCLENGGAYRSALSFEPFVATGPWTVGTDGTSEQQSVSPNQLVQAGSRSMTFAVKETAQTADKVTGKLSISYFDSRLDVLNGYKITFTNCFGSQSFEAIPA
jgi:hypothetical protein